jgi:hypothetical protein
MEFRKMLGTLVLGSSLKMRRERCVVLFCMISDWRCFETLQGEAEAIAALRFAASGR